VGAKLQCLTEWWVQLLVPVIWRFENSRVEKLEFYCGYKGTSTVDKKVENDTLIWKDMKFPLAQGFHSGPGTREID